MLYYIVDDRPDRCIRFSNEITTRAVEETGRFVPASLVMVMVLHCCNNIIHNLLVASLSMLLITLQDKTSKPDAQVLLLNCKFATKLEVTTTTPWL